MNTLLIIYFFQEIHPVKVQMFFNSKTQTKKIHIPYSPLIDLPFVDVGYYTSTSTILCSAMLSYIYYAGSRFVLFFPAWTPSYSIQSYVCHFSYILMEHTFRPPCFHIFLILILLEENKACYLSKVFPGIQSRHFVIVQTVLSTEIPQFYASLVSVRCPVSSELSDVLTHIHSCDV